MGHLQFQYDIWDDRMATVAHPECSGWHLNGSIQVNLTCQCSVRMWAVVPQVKDLVSFGQFGMESVSDPCVMAFAKN